MERLTEAGYKYHSCDFMEDGMYEWANRLSEYEDTGLTPPEIMELKGSIRKLQEHFGDAITADQVIDFFVDFYIAQCDDERVEAAELLTNEEVERYKRLKERDTVKAPVDIDEEFDMYVCPSCNMAIGTIGDKKNHHFCLNCGQRIRLEE